MEFQFYNELIEDAKKIREKVFVEEQGFQQEFDDIDLTCIHMVMYDQSQPIGCARMYEDNGDMVFGRIAVLKEYRHKHLGSQILVQLEKKAQDLGYNKVVLSAQVRASEFYVKNGYVAYGEEYLDEYCPHIHMKKELNRY